MLFGLRPAVLLGGLAAAARRGSPAAALGLLRDVRPFVRLQFLVAARRLGVLGALADRPAPASALAGRLGVERRDLLEALLEVGVALGELGRRGGSYRLRGRRARALASPDGDPLSALAEELVLYHGEVYGDLPRVARGGPARDYLAEVGTIVARSSRVAEPFIAAWVRDALRGRPAPSLLDLGCGSGAYLRVAAVTSPRASGVGIELQPEVAALAADNLERWAIGDRFRVLQGDARALLATLECRFDVVLAANNLYYFTAPERVDLFSRLRGALAAEGTLLLVSLLAGAGLTNRDLDLVLAATPGCHPMPSLAAVTGELHRAGFGVCAHRLVPGEAFHALTARPLPR